MNYIISGCSTADVTKEWLDARGIPFVKFHYRIDGVEHEDDLVSMPMKQFYQMIRDGADTETSQVNTAEYVDYFTALLSQGMDVLHVELSSGISGSANSAKIAADMVRPNFPERRLYVVDSLAASSGIALLLDKMTELRDGGMSIEELYAWTEANKQCVHHLFYSADLTTFIKGGRISKIEGIFGGALHICPLMDVSEDGRLVPRVKARGKKRAMQELMKKMAVYVDDGADYSGKVYISHADSDDDAREMKAMIEAAYPKLAEKVSIFDIGTTIGSHTGPGTVAVFFWGITRKGLYDATNK